MPPPPNTRPSCRFFTILLSVLVPVLAAAAALVFQLDSFDPVPLPFRELTPLPLAASSKNGHMLRGAEFVGQGKLNSPEDIAYDSKSGLIYTTTADGWVKRVTVNDSVADMAVEDWVYTGGRPLGVVLGRNNEVIVADAYKGLLKVTDGAVDLLTNQADGLPFNLTDAADIADDGTIYFTDASHKYQLHDALWDLLEGKPNGRLMSFDPVTKQTKLLLSDLYFANGVALTPDQRSVVFCETSMRRCRKYYIKGDKKGKVENFIDHLPGLPDNIHYDGDGHYWVALAMGIDTFWDLVFRYPFIRKAFAIWTRHIGPTNMDNNAGVFVVDLEGRPIAHYHDPKLSFFSTGVKIGAHLYCGSIVYPYIIRLDLTKHPAQATA